MKSFGYYFTLTLYPIAFFFALGGIELLVLRQAYQKQADMQLAPYVDGKPIPEVELKIDRRPQSINIPSIDTAPSSPSPKVDRLVSPTP